MPVRVSNPVHLTVLDPINTVFSSRKTSARTPAGEILQPFQIAAFGGVAFTTDPVERAKGHLLAVLLTRTGERVMRPAYGTGVWNYLFEVDPRYLGSELSISLQQAVQTWEPTLRVASVTPIQDPLDPATVAVKISFTLSGNPEVHEVTYDSNGNRLEI